MLSAYDPHSHLHDFVPNNAVANDALGRAASRHCYAQEAREAIQQQQLVHGYNFDGIAHVQSCFVERRGTPRQGVLVPGARARIKFRTSIPPASLECLDQFSHLWVIFVFHENTNVAKTSGSSASGKRASTFPAKIAPPRYVSA